MSQEQFDCEVMQELEQAQHDIALLDLLRKTLSYDSSTGLFTRLRHGAGKVAGTVDSHGYIQISIGGKTYRAHRLVWLYVHGVFPQNDLDHINGVRHDNRLSNLRDVTRSVNLQNKRVQSNSVTGVKGISPSGRGFVARIKAPNQPQMYLGKFKTADEAQAAYVKASQELHDLPV